MGGSRSVFTGKVKKSKYRVQGWLTPVGMEKFEQARVRLAAIAAREVGLVSDADVIEFLARGFDDTVRYLNDK